MILDPAGEPGRAAREVDAGRPRIGPDLAELLRAGVLCNDSSLYQEDGHWHISGDPTEGALIVSAAKVASTARTWTLLPPTGHGPIRVRASVHGHLASSGPPRGHGFPGSRMPPSPTSRERWRRWWLAVRTSWRRTARWSLWTQRSKTGGPEMASKGLRVLAFARKELPAGTDEITHEHVERGLSSWGFRA